MRLLLSITSFILLVSCGSSIDKKNLVNEFIFSDIPTLTKKYGEPEKYSSSTSLDHSLTWRLNDDEDIKVMMFYKTSDFEKPYVARFFNMEMSYLFNDDLGWDPGTLKFNEPEQAMSVKNLKGIKEAKYKTELKLLNIVLDDPNPQTFGTLKY